MFYQLPPVGNPICLDISAGEGATLESVAHPYQPCYFASGTAALAAAVSAAIKNKGTPDPEVLIPAYGCPDLVSAVVHAGARPILVDLEPDRPWMDVDKLSASLSPDSVAVIAASLCGIPERMDRLRSVAGERGLVLIEDSAQAFPGGQERPSWNGDLVVLSFGRGKPVSLLGGGAVLARDAALGSLLPEPLGLPGGGQHEVSFRIKASLYNTMIRPGWYWIPQGMPFLHLGETRYHPLAAIEGMDRLRKSLLPANIARYRKHDAGAEKLLRRMLEPMDGRLIDLPGVCGVAHERRLLRYPLLLDAENRNAVLRDFRAQGLGASTLYPSILPGIPGLEELLGGQGAFPRAEAFAKRILTLPTHVGVRHKDISRMRSILERLLQASRSPKNGCD